MMAIELSGLTREDIKNYLVGIGKYSEEALKKCDTDELKSEYLLAKTIIEPPTKKEMIGYLGYGNSCHFSGHLIDPRNMDLYLLKAVYRNEILLREEGRTCMVSKDKIKETVQQLKDIGEDPERHGFGGLV